jgi:site-specific DNA recombinase
MYTDIVETLKQYNSSFYQRRSQDAEDRQIASLGDQQMANEKTAERYGLNVANRHIFTESQSAKNPGRLEFNRLVEAIERGEIQIIVSWHANRIARNGLDAGKIIQLLSDDKLKAIITPHKAFFNNGSDIFMLYVDFGQSDKYSKDLSDVVKRGMYSKIKRGFWPGRPPLGYQNTKTDGEEPKQVIDPKRFSKLRSAVELILYKNYPIPRALMELNEKMEFRTRKTKGIGKVPLGKSSFYRILSEPFFYGKLKWGGEEGTLHESVPRLMTETEFWKIQDLLGTKGKPRPQKHTDLPYRAMIKCGECNSTWVPYKQKKKLVSGDYAYYNYIKCNCDKTRGHCTQKQMSIAQLEKQVATILETVTVSEDFGTWATKWIKEEHKAEENKQGEVLEGLQRALESNQSKLNRLVDLHLEGLSKEEYNAKRKELETKRNNITRDLKALESRTYNWIDLAVNTFNFAKSAREAFEKGTAEEKTEILKTLGSNFFIKDGKLNIDLQKPFIEFKNNHELVNAELKTIGMDDMVAVGANNKVFEDWFFKWSGWPDSNRRPHAPKARTLAN